MDRTKITNCLSLLQKVCLFGSQSWRKSQRKREREIFHSPFLSPICSRARTELMQKQQSGGSPRGLTWVQYPKHMSHLPKPFPSCQQGVGSEGAASTESGTHAGCRLSKQQCHLICHTPDPMYHFFNSCYTPDKKFIFFESLLQFSGLCTPSCKSDIIGEKNNMQILINKNNKLVTLQN